jgi:Fe-S oxidoreductase
LQRPDGDFSHEVKEAMDGCLACKSCVGQCPIKVDVPAFRSRFLEVYHGRYVRPLRDYLVAALERSLPHAARFPRLANALTQNAIGAAALRAAGLVAVPALSTMDFDAALARLGVQRASVMALKGLSADEIRRSVLVVQDAFTTHYDAQVVLDFLELLTRLGFRPWLAPFLPNGKPQHVLGFLGEFERTAAANARMLRELAATGVELVGVDPSMTLTCRAEYVRALGQEAVPRVALPQEWLAAHLQDLPTRPLDAAHRWSLAPHCTERTNAPAAIADWTAVFRRLGLALDVVQAGCCGMAGLYGHERAHRATSQEIYGLSWARIVAERGDEGGLLATGYSCRCQADLVDGMRLPHPLQVLLQALKEPVREWPVRVAPPLVERAERHEEA